MLAVPALALAGNWPLAAALIIAERTGRAIRRPSVESMLAHAGHSIGHGWVFGLNEALDQTGATLGPLITAWILYRHGNYQHAFAVLLISALLCLSVLTVAFFFFRRPQDLESQPRQLASGKGMSRRFWLYLIAGALIAAGFADFSLIAFHFRQSATVPDGLIPVFYAAAMATGAISSLLIGKLLDRFGLPVLLVAFGIPAFFAPLVFLYGSQLELAGMVLWGMGMGAQDSCLKAILAPIVPSDKRSTAFGLFDTAFGIAWFAGSAAMGLLYDKSIPALIAFSMILQLAALPVFAIAAKEKSHAYR
jgi:predicted MFS family arabinose efflux permease